VRTFSARPRAFRSHPVLYLDAGRAGRAHSSPGVRRALDAETNSTSDSTAEVETAERFGDGVKGGPPLVFVAAIRSAPLPEQAARNAMRMRALTRPPPHGEQADPKELARRTCRLAARQSRADSVPTGEATAAAKVVEPGRALERMQHRPDWIALGGNQRSENVTTNGGARFEHAPHARNTASGFVRYSNRGGAQHGIEVAHPETQSGLRLRSCTTRSRRRGILFELLGIEAEAGDIEFELFRQLRHPARQRSSTCMPGREKARYSSVIWARTLHPDAEPGVADNRTVCPRAHRGAECVID